MMFFYLYDKRQLNSNLPNAIRSGARPQTGLFTFILNRNRGRVPWSGLVYARHGREFVECKSPVGGSPAGVVTAAFSRRLGDELIVLGMSADPDPVDVACFINAQCSIMVANAD